MFDCDVGDAVITMDKAGMWTDGRYFLQAKMQMDDNWTLMKMGKVSLSSSFLFYLSLKDHSKSKVKASWSRGFLRVIKVYCVTRSRGRCPFCLQ